MNRRYVLLLIILGLSLSISLYYSARIHNSHKDKTIRVTVDRPSESDPAKSGYKWEGAPNDPKKLVIPEIDLDGYIIKVAIDQKNDVAAPNNINLAGWYVRSVRPGNKGLSVIDGHLDGNSKPGIFNKLSELKIGNKFTVQYGDDSKKQFQVISTNTVDTDRAVGYIFSQDPKVKSQLNLVTCGGNFDKSKHLYDKRVVVASSLIN